MKLVLKQRFFSWLDSYDIYDEEGNTVYTVKGELALGHCFKIFDVAGNELGMIKQQVFTFLPKFEIYRGSTCIGCIKKEFSLFKPVFDIDYNGWHMEGNFWEWDYTIQDASGRSIAQISKELNWTDTYVIDVYNSSDALDVLLLVLAIDAEKCSRDN